MDKNLIQQYLANVWAVACADNIISDSERAAVEEVCSGIGGKKSDLKKAETLAQSEAFAPRPIGRFSDKVQNIEDMIYVSLADGELGEDEIAKIIPFITKLGLSQDIADIMIAEGQARVASKQAITTCPQCDASIAGGAKFCPECGAQILATAPSEAAVQVEFNYPSRGISVEFAESSSANFETALAIAQAAPDFQVCEKSRKQWHLATWPEDQIAGALTLVVALDGLRNRKAYVNGESVQWDEVFGFGWCFQRRQQAYRPAEYCFGVDEDRLNIWGCRQAGMDWTSWADWLGYGQFKKKDVFVFDENRIRHELQTNLYKVRFCPCLRSEFVSTVLRLFPNQVQVSDRSGWSYKKEYEQGPNSMKVVEKQVQDGFAYKDEFWTSGVSPVGCAAAIDILKQALKQCPMKDISVKMLKP